MTWWAMCRGEGLKICESCQRHPDNAESAGKWQAWMTPHTQDGKCIDHRGIPDREPRKR